MLLTAALLLVAIGLVHSILGERYILKRLDRRELPRLFGSDVFTKRTLRFAWHITTIAWWGFAALLVGGLESPRVALQIIAATFGVTGLIALVGGRGRHLAWIVFLAVAALVGWAALGY